MHACAVQQKEQYIVLICVRVTRLVYITTCTSNIEQQSNSLVTAALAQGATKLVARL